MKDCDNAVIIISNNFTVGVNMKNKSLFGGLLLLLAAIIWGCSFVAQSEGMNYVGSFTFQCTRCFLAGLTLLPFILVSNKKKAKKEPEENQTSADKKMLIKGGIVCGIIFGVSVCLQQLGLENDTNPGKAAFITALYIVLVPIFNIFLKKRPPVRIWFGVALAVGGLYCLCVSDGFSELSMGDLYCIACAVGFACHILAIGYFGSRVDCVKLSCIQFFVAAVGSAVPMFIFENVTFSAIKDAAVPILYSGVLSGGAAFTFQAIGQKYTREESASLIMSLESVVAVIAGMIILKQFPSAREWIGCALMFTAIILAQIEPKRKKQAKEAV